MGNKKEKMEKVKNGMIGVALFAMLPFALIYLLWIPILIEHNPDSLLKPIPFMIVWAILIFVMFWKFGKIEDSDNSEKVK